MLLLCKKNNAEVSTYLVLTPTFIIEPIKTLSLIQTEKAFSGTQVLKKA